MLQYCRSPIVPILGNPQCLCYCHTQGPHSSFLLSSCLPDGETGNDQLGPLEMWAERGPAGQLKGYHKKRKRPGHSSSSTQTMKPNINGLPMRASALPGARFTFTCHVPACGHGYLLPTKGRDSCEMTGVGAENWTLVLWWNSICLQLPDQRFSPCDPNTPSRGHIADALRFITVAKFIMK